MVYMGAFYAFAFRVNPKVLQIAYKINYYFFIERKTIANNDIIFSI